jgi:hypothetical protein
MNPTTNPSGGFNWGQALGTGASLYGSYLGAQNNNALMSGYNQGIGQSGGAYNPSLFGMQGVGGTGFSVSSPNGGPGSIQSSLGAFNPMYGNYAGAAGQYLGQSQGLANTAASGATGAYQSALSSIMPQLQQMQGNLLSANNNALFQRGQMGSGSFGQNIGNGQNNPVNLTTQSLGQGFASQDLNAITAAQNQGLNFFNSNLAGAQSLGNLGMGATNSGMGMIGAQNSLAQNPLAYSGLYGNQEIGAANATANNVRAGNYQGQGPQSGTGNLLTSLGSGLTSGNSPLSSMMSQFGSGSNGFGGGSNNPFNNPASGLYDNTGGANAFNPNITQGFTNPDMSNLLGDPSSWDSFSSAGGQAATAGASAGLTNFGTSDADTAASGILGDAAQNGTGAIQWAGGTSPLGEATSALNIYNGLSAGTPQGYVQAGQGAVSGAQAAGMLSGGAALAAAAPLALTAYAMSTPTTQLDSTYWGNLQNEMTAGQQPGATVQSRLTEAEALGTYGSFMNGSGNQGAGGTAGANPALIAQQLGKYGIDNMSQLYAAQQDIYNSLDGEIPGEGAASYAKGSGSNGRYAAS